MAFYLKKTKNNGRTYLSIDESFYNHDKKGTAHRCYKSLQSVETHIKNGIKDPIAHFQKEVDELNRVKNDEGAKKISDNSPIVHLGYFPLKSIIDKLKVQQYVNYFKLTTDFEFDLFELITSLVYARSVKPCSKRKTFHEVLPNLFHSINYSYDQLLTGLSFIGLNYSKFIEIFTTQVKKYYKLNTERTYFDCTNFYFEIDREDDFRRKGPSKENRTEPIVGLGLLLDANLIPIGMQMYPGNESEKPVLRNVINSLKMQNNITGKTIHVADKGLNCTKNIAFSKGKKDGYLFSKSVKSLPEKEKTWVLIKDNFKVKKDDKGKILYYYKSCVDEFPYTVEHKGKKETINFTEKRLLTFNPTLAKKQRNEIKKMIEKAKDLTHSQAKKHEYGISSKYVDFVDVDGKKAKAKINNDKISKDLQFAGFNLLVTSEIDMTDKDMYETYHKLWRIEESFKIMKSDLDARPVFVQKEATIKGHFLICYIAVLLERILQFHVLNKEEEQYSTSEILNFIRDFSAIKVNSKYINTTAYTKFVDDLTKKFNLPLTNYFLSETQIKTIFNQKF